MQSAKNMMLSPAATDLGLGAQLQQQVADTVEERRKKLLKQAGVLEFGAAMSPAAQSLLGAGSYSV